MVSAAVVVFCLHTLQTSLRLTCKLLVELQYIVEIAENTIFDNTHVRKNVLPPLAQQRGPGPALDKQAVHSDDADKQTFHGDKEIGCSAIRL